MRKIICLVLAVALLVQPAFANPVLLNSGSAKAKQIVEIKYTEPSHFFYIGEGKEGFDIKMMKERLLQYRNSHANVKYAFKSDYKLVPSKEQEIRNIIKEAGIELEHFLVPSSFDKEGFVDLDSKKINDTDFKTRN